MNSVLTVQVDNLSELLREVQMLKVTREVQAVISAATPGGGGVAAGVAAAFQPASQQLQSLENLMKHNDRCLASLFWHTGKWHCLIASQRCNDLAHEKDWIHTPSVC